MNKVFELAQKIKLVMFDVDGVLTDGKLYLDDKGLETKAFHAHDGIGIKLLQRAGIDVAIVTARQSKLVSIRMASLDIPYVYQAVQDKFKVYSELQEKLHLKKEEICMVGDDLVDAKVIHDCGLGIAVANAQSFVKEQADYVTQIAGGDGVAREVCQLILRAQRKLAALQQAYLR